MRWARRALEEVARSGYQFSVLYGREMGRFFANAGSYIVLTVVLFVQACLFGLSFQAMRGEMREVIGFYFSNIFFYIMMFVLPAVITMRLFAEEKKRGTLEMLVAAPVRDYEVVLAKYASALSMQAMIWAPSILFFVFLAGKADGVPDWGPLISSGIGVALLSAFLLSLGLFTSALTEDQVVAAVLAVIFSIFFFGLGSVRSLFPDPSMTHTLRLYNPIEQFGKDFANGVVDSRVVLFYLSTSAFFLFGTLKVFEGRRWQ